MEKVQFVKPRSVPKGSPMDKFSTKASVGFFVLSFFTMIAFDYWKSDALQKRLDIGWYDETEENKRKDFMMRSFKLVVPPHRSSESFDKEEKESAENITYESHRGPPSGFGTSFDE